MIIPCNVYLFFFSSIVLTLINLYLFHVYRYPYPEGMKDRNFFFKVIFDSKITGGNYQQHPYDPVNTDIISIEITLQKSRNYHRNSIHI